jgi:protein SCO1/2
MTRLTKAFQDMLAGLFGLILATIVPVHGVLLTQGAHGTGVVRIDAVPSMLAAQTRTFSVEASARLEPGEEIDGFVDPSRSPWRLFGVEPASRFIPGLANRAVPHVVREGDSLPDGQFVDQTGKLLSLSELRGKTTILTFVYTRCRDLNICPAISGKFAYLQRQLDRKRFHLVEITLDPLNDSPAVLARYGTQFGADPRTWSLLTSRPSTVGNVINEFDLSSLASPAGDLIHDNLLAIVDPTGHVRSIVTMAGWDPEDVIAQAHDVAGLESNPFRRLELDTFARVTQMCGGSASMAQTVLGLSVGVLFVPFLVAFLVLFWRRVTREA